MQKYNLQKISSKKETKILQDIITQENLHGLKNKNKNKNKIVGPGFTYIL